MSLPRCGLAIVCAMLFWASAVSTAVADQPFIAPKCCTTCGPTCQSCPLPPPINICKPVCEVTICKTQPVCRPTCEHRVCPVNICKPVCEVTICKTQPVCRPTCETRLCPVNIRSMCEPVLTCNKVCKGAAYEPAPCHAPCSTCK